METSDTNNKVISAEEVITKLKDDGDFDKLRLKIIQKLKENEELRNNIISTVKQSAAINREGAENLKPRQLSDAIHEEIGNEVISQISDALWGVIRSNDGMKSEISKTVESVYNVLLNPKVLEPSPTRDPMPSDKEASNNCSLAPSARECEDDPSYSEPKEVPGVSAACNNQQANTNEGEQKEDAQPVTPNLRHTEEMEDRRNQEILSTYDDDDDDDPSVPPGFDTFVKSEQQCDVIDEDPDVPPGFG